MKSLAVGLSLGLAGAASAQVHIHDESCGTQLTPDGARIALERQSAGFYEPVARPETAARVAIAIHIVRTSAGTGGIDPAQIDQAIEDANQHFDPIIEFCALEEIDYIDSDFWYTFAPGASYDTLRQINPVHGAINVYFAPVTPGLCGISSFSFGGVQGIVMNNNCTGLPSNPSTFSHELGHYFDLFHTHETAFGLECTAGTNSRLAGDLVTDTPADPTLGSNNVDPNSCAFTAMIPGPCPEDPNYDPQPDNLMSYSLKTCRDMFTLEQKDRALSTLANARIELDLNACSGVVVCYPDCDQSTGVGVLDVFDFLCFQDSFVAGAPYSDCDNSGTHDVFDFLCFQDAFANGCP
jgi:hypothetical protein